MVEHFRLVQALLMHLTPTGRIIFSTGATLWQTPGPPGARVRFCHTHHHTGIPAHKRRSHGLGFPTSRPSVSRELRVRLVTVLVSHLATGRAPGVLAPLVLAQSPPLRLAGATQRIDGQRFPR